MRRNGPKLIEISGALELCAPPDVVIEALEPLVTQERIERIDAVIGARTRSRTLVLDRLFDPHNRAAVLRSADAFGVQDVHVIEDDTDAPFLASERISTGAERWLDIRRHATPEPCLAQLRSEGYEVYVASMDGDLRPEDLSLRPKVAIVLGNEHRGVAPVWRENADGVYAIPMRGFVESLNVSVAAAITLFAATRGHDGDLSSRERMTLRARFLMRSVPRPQEVVAEHMRRRAHSASR